MGRDLGLLLLRFSLGFFMLTCHGWKKLVEFPSLSATFSDPLGIGSLYSLCLAIFAEVFCSILLILGIKTRLAAIAPAIMMMVIIVMFHGVTDLAKAELSYLYLFGYMTLIFTGGGSLSLGKE